jgi:uncharacterized protein involved in type VI secretion and phage assembly
MTAIGPFATPAHWLGGAHLARVTSVKDPDKKARVQVQMMGPDADRHALLWARVAVPFAGDNRGAFLIPDVGDEVVVLFIGNDPRFPVVVGALWNGGTEVPEEIGGDGDRIDRWTITGKAGTRIAIVEAATGQEKVEIETPNGVKATLTDATGGSIQLQTTPSNSVTLDTQGVSVTTTGKVSVNASLVDIHAGIVTVNSGISHFTGMVLCQALITNSVISASYTPGAGNIL